MKNPLVKIILVSVIILVYGCQGQEVRLEKAMAKSISWLWAQQSPDGGWHSQTHAVLKDGRALSPYILYHLLLIPEEKYQRPPGGIEKAVAFIQREITASLSMREDSLPFLNYPNYSAAYALKVLCLVQKDSALQNMIAGHLLREQFIEHRGITPDHLAYGGWGYGEPGLPFGEHGHVDISHTRRIVESMKYALRLTSLQAGGKAKTKAKDEDEAEAKDKDKDKDEAKAKAKRVGVGQLLNPQRERFDSANKAVKYFLKGVQRVREDPRLYEGCISRKELPYDGGFISSAVTLATNKSQSVLIEGAGFHYPSYATATCDGLMAMHTLGMTATQAYRDAKKWLADHQDMRTIEGLSKDDPEQWHQVMHYYHLAVRAEAMTVAGIKGKWSKEIRRILIREQTPEGYYINPMGGVNKEDDPLMATILAVQAGAVLDFGF